MPSLMLSRSVHLDLPLPPDEVLARLEQVLGNWRGPLLDGPGGPPGVPPGAEYVGHVDEASFVLRTAGSERLWRNTHAVGRGRVMPVPGEGSRLMLRFRPVFIDSPPLKLLLLLSVLGGAAAWSSGEWAALGLILLLWAVPLMIALVSQLWLDAEVRDAVRFLDTRLREGLGPGPRA